MSSNVKQNVRYKKKDNNKMTGTEKNAKEASNNEDDDSDAQFCADKTQKQLKAASMDASPMSLKTNDYGYSVDSEEDDGEKKKKAVPTKLNCVSEEASGVPDTDDLSVGTDITVDEEDMDAQIAETEKALKKLEDMKRAMAMKKETKIKEAETRKKKAIEIVKIRNMVSSNEMETNEAVAQQATVSVTTQREKEADGVLTDKEAGIFLDKEIILPNQKVRLVQLFKRNSLKRIF
jgi:hypothetical protein